LGAIPRRGKKPKEAIVFEFWLTPRLGGGAWRWEKCLEGEGVGYVRAGPAFNFMKAAAFERTYESSFGGKPRRVNPIGGSGMK
jgi:hypothetical protein